MTLLTNTLSYKKFIFSFFCCIFLYLSYHIYIYSFYTSKIFNRRDQLYVGDLGRMSYQVDSLVPRRLKYTLPKRILNATNINFNIPIDIITIGDSFSNGGAGGVNPYYQDYLASKYNLNILNIVNFTQNQHKLFDAIIALYNNGWLKKHKPKLIIIESAQRGVYTRFAKNFNFTENKINLNKMIEPAKKEDPYLPHLKLINTANYKLPFYTIKYKFKHRAQRDVAKFTLSKNFFSTKNYQHFLLFHFDDVKDIKNNKKLVIQINENFNYLANLLHKLDIQLLFLVAPDKYSIYYDYIQNNPYPKNNFFKLIKPLQKNYLFIDTELLLKNTLAKGVKDLYYSDDTHWSYKASDIITNHVIFKKIFKKKSQ